ncbi:MAG TPA: NAD-dependent epimerase [Planctomycetaceae bacterium]|nr:NAD-dependent epimerase [Planctomycetaceae bacterium]
MKVLVSGSSGLIGSEAVVHYDSLGAEVIGVDNNLRAEFFGPQGDTRWNLQRLQGLTRRFSPWSIDLRNRDALFGLFQSEGPFDRVIHCAAQPSHDKAREIPILDFEVNANGTLHMLEATRLHSPGAVFIQMSTNKVYGDAPNEVPLIELDTRWDYLRSQDWHGISEQCRIDQSLHSLFGASKTAGDILAQEYGRTFGLKTGIFRGGCLTGPAHSGVELHGFLSYIVHAAVHGKPYRIFGYQGKQVRDQIHSADVIAAFEAFAQNPRPGEVYNLGGGRGNSASVLEVIDLIQRLGGHRLQHTYVPENRLGDHICYISDLRKLQSHYPDWQITRDLPAILEEMIAAERSRAGIRRAA